MAWRVTTPLIGTQPIDSVDTVKRHEIGLTVQAIDPAYGAGQFVYCGTNAAVPARGWCVYNTDDGTVSPVNATAIGPVGVAMAAGVASGFGWFQVSGKALGAAAAGFVDNAKVYGTSTDYVVDDAVVTGDMVVNAKGASALSGSSAEFEINFPFVNDVTG
jgi:hypothetical protein